jgi:hypothetical protein
MMLLLVVEVMEVMFVVFLHDIDAGCGRCRSSTAVVILGRQRL